MSLMILYMRINLEFFRLFFRVSHPRSFSNSVVDECLNAPVQSMAARLWTCSSECDSKFVQLSKTALPYSNIGRMKLM